MSGPYVSLREVRAGTTLAEELERLCGLGPLDVVLSKLCFCHHHAAIDIVVEGVRCIGLNAVGAPAISSPST